MQIPTFSYMGGKARIRDWLIYYFPKTGNRYLEPFVGMGNMFFLSKNKLAFKHFEISDMDVGFFKALLNANLNDIPERITKEEFHDWKNRNDNISKIVENQLTFAGKGYKAGYCGDRDTHPSFNGSLYKKKLRRTREFLNGVGIHERLWDEIEYDKYDNNDFIYFDPPYFEYNTKSGYPNIDHSKLISTINNLKCKWALSGYDNELYKSELKYKKRYECERNGEIKSASTGKYVAVTEVLWTNY